MERDDDFSEGDRDHADEMPWEAAARKAVEEAARDVDYDETRGVIYLESGRDHRLSRVQEGFSSYDALWDRLIEIGENEWTNYAPFEGGEMVFEPHVDGYVEGALDWEKIEDFFARIEAPNGGEELVNARELLFPKAGLVTQVDVEEVNAELIRYLARHPEQMRELNPRKFETVVAELFKNKGYEVELTKRTRDGGLDIRAYRRSDIGTLLGLIECKRYSANNKVSVEIVRGLYGVVASEKASFGIVATTSTFTKDARSFQQTNRYQLQLADYENLVQWLKDYRIDPRDA